MTASIPARQVTKFRIRPLSALIAGVCISAVGAQPAFAQQEVKDVITVIGEKTDRTIYDTSSSVEVYDSDRLDSTPNANEIKDLIQLAPNVVDSGLGNNLPAIRGVDASGPSIGGIASFSGSRPRVNLSIDGRSLNYSEIAFGPRSLWDMEQAEIYLGPQSYIQGRNAIAGAIVMKSKDPTYDFESAVKVAVGQHNYSQTAAIISAPIVEDQLAFRLSVDQQKRKSHIEMISYDPVGDSRDIEMSTVRAKLLLEPTSLPGFRTGLSVAYLDSRSPQSEHDISSGYTADRAIYETDSISYAWDTGFDVNDHLRFETNVIYTDFVNHRRTPPSYPADFLIEGDEIQAEAIVRYNALQDKLYGLAGIRYFNSEQDEVYIHSAGSSPMYDRTVTKSAFAEVSYDVVPEVTVTFAGRFEQEHKIRVVEPNPLNMTVDYDETFSEFLPRFDIAYKPANTSTVGFKIAKGYNGGGAGLGFDSTGGRYQDFEYDSEYVWNYELYTRHALADGAVELTSNIFFNDYDNFQISQRNDNDISVVTNIDNAETYGAEIATRWYATSDVELYANLGWLETEYKEKASQGGKTLELDRSPAFTSTLGGLFYFGDGFELSANAKYTSEYYSEKDNIEELKIDGYWLVDAQFAYDFEYGRAALFVENLFDSDDELLYSASRTGTEVLKQRERLIGASLELRF
ncbi:TonB-dependent receptor [Vibrio intestinalis]|uniref:TonB-dependent receptor n=1 Tax=Vibrio intestinalis TaxID=2933291 RepID=UPI0021A8F155|nr:TonB-dependent receptor plug domain-containing protein [Vibrio intestinalis]